MVHPDLSRFQHPVLVHNEGELMISSAECPSEHITHLH